MTVRRGLTVVGLTALVCGLVGASVGCVLGHYAPNYYRVVFGVRPSDPFSLVEFGVGLGLTQGLIAGIVVGCVVVLSVGWYSSRREVIVREWAASPSWPEQPVQTASEAIRPASPPHYDGSAS